MQKTKRLDWLQKILAVFGVVCAGTVWHFADEHGGAHDGASGGAAGCGIMAAACFICVVWIELKTTKNQEKL